MKKENLDMLLAQVVDANVFRNDGRGNIYLYRKDFGVWIRQTPLMARRALSIIFSARNITLRRDNLLNIQREIAEWYVLTEPRLATDEPTQFVAVRNGVVDLATGQLQKHDPALFLRYFLDFKYLDDVKVIPTDNSWLKFVATSLGIDTKNLHADPLWRLFKEAFFFPMTNLGNAKKMVIFLGPPNCGKSVILKLMGKTIGEDAFVALSFEDMVQRFRGSLMEGHRLILSHEMPLKPLRRLDVMKKIISGDPIIIEEKCLNARQYIPRINIVFAANNMPALAEPDSGGAFADRLLIVPFQKVSQRDTALVDKLWNDRDVFLTLAAKSMADFIKRGLVFSECPKGEKIVEEFRKEAFSLSAFVEEKFEKKNGSNICFTDFFEDYVTFCDEIVVPAVSKSEMKNALLQMGLTFKRARVPGRPNAVSCLVGLEKKPDASMPHLLHAKSKP